MSRPAYPSDLNNEEWKLSILANLAEAPRSIACDERRDECQ